MDLIMMVLDTIEKWEQLLPLAVTSVFFTVIAVILFLFSSRLPFRSFFNKYRIVALAVLLICWGVSSVVLAMGVVWSVYIYTSAHGLTLGEKLIYTSNAAVTCSILGMLMNGAMVIITSVVTMMTSKGGAAKESNRLADSGRTHEGSDDGV